jgi:hypothetical protein
MNMIAKPTLQKAVNENIIQAEQLEPLYQFLQSENTENEIDAREEPLKFIRSFGDVFITLGIILLAISINRINFTGYEAVIPVVGFIAVAEWLVRVRRLALPGMAILIAVLFFVNKAAPIEYDASTMSGLAVLGLTSLLFYLRYKMPFSLLPLTACLLAIAVIQIGLDVLETPIIFAAFGVIVFAVAMWFDAQDTKRVSHMSDSAFWLHLLAAPLFVHGVMASMLISESSLFEIINKEMMIFIFFVVFFLLALLVDRRAMLVSTQLYVIYALTQLFQDRVSGTQDVIIYIVMAIGLFVIYFGAYWYKTRRLIFGFMSGSEISNYIPDLNSTDVKR